MMIDSTDAGCASSISLISAKFVRDPHSAIRLSRFALKRTHMDKGPFATKIWRYESISPVVIPIRDPSDVSHASGVKMKVF